MTAADFNSTQEDITPFWIPYHDFVYDSVVMQLLHTVFNLSNYQPWILSIIGSIVVGLSGIFPLFIIPLDETASLKDGAGAKTLRLLLSFAVGGLLGDVFLHLLPEAWKNQYANKTTVTGKLNTGPCLTCGLWVLAGLLAFIIVEKIFSYEKDEEDDGEGDTTVKNMPIRRKKSSFVLNELITNTNNNNVVAFIASNIIKTNTEKPPLIKKPSSIQVSGYLNLMANSIDNFTHGLAVGGSFLLSTRVGLFTTFAILVHEIPHEVGDFAILLRAGFTRWDAAWAQVYTATAGILGALTALICSASANTVEARTSWILPFTAGGFLHISLVTILPELLSEKNAKESFKQLCSLATGITMMALLTAVIEDH